MNIRFNMKKILLALIFLLYINVNASIVVMDADSGRILYSKNKSERKLIASTTKIMTTIIALENAKLTEYEINTMAQSRITDMINTPNAIKTSGNDSAKSNGQRPMPPSSVPVPPNSDPNMQPKRQMPIPPKALN